MSNWVKCMQYTVRVVHTCKHSLQEAEAVESLTTRGQPRMLVRSCLKRKHSVHELLGGMLSVSQHAEGAVVEATRVLLILCQRKN